MSEAPNAAQVAYWNDAAGQTWAEMQEALDRQLAPLGRAAMAALAPTPGERLLDIGCGAGQTTLELAAAVAPGGEVLGLDISRPLLEVARARPAVPGVRFLEGDAQTHAFEPAGFDGAFSRFGVMFFADPPAAFANIRRALKPGGRAAIQGITINPTIFDQYRGKRDFIQKYIFPGGMLPAPSVLRAEVEKAGLRVKGSIEFGESYSLTLRRWHEVFESRWAEIRKLGFDDRFKRMWDFYLASCAGAFQGGNCDVTQITVTRPG